MVPKIRATILGCPSTKDYSILGSILGCPCFGKLPGVLGNGFGGLELRVSDSAQGVGHWHYYFSLGFVNWDLALTICRLKPKKGHSIRYS